MEHHILVVDDDPIISALLDETLSSHGYRTTLLDNGDAAVDACLADDSIDLALIDYAMKPTDGLTTARRIRKTSGIGFLFVTGFIAEDIVSEATRLGALGYIVKPVIPDAVLPQIQIAIMRSRDIHALNHSRLNTRAIYLAIGIVSEKHRIPTSEAQRRLSEVCRRTRRRLPDICAEIVEESDKLNTATRQHAATLLDLLAGI